MKNHNGLRKSYRWPRIAAVCGIVIATLALVFTWFFQSHECLVKDRSFFAELSRTPIDNKHRKPWQPPEVVAILGADRAGGWDEINTVVVDAGGRLVARGGIDELVHLWHSRNTRKPYLLRGHTQAITALAFSSNVALLASAGHDGKVQLKPRRNRSHLELTKAEAGSNNLAISFRLGIGRRGVFPR